MKQIPYDPEKHKGYAVLVKDGKGTYFHPTQVPAMRVQGWKTLKEHARIEGKRARKAAKNAPAAQTVADVIFNNQNTDDAAAI